MSKIATYGLADTPLQLSDRLIGTEAPRPTPSSTPLATKNFSLGELLQLFSSNFPAASLQAVLNTGNTATQNITLTGTITTSVVKPQNIEDDLGSQGTVFQFLSKGASGINWVDLPQIYPTLDEVLTAGNVSILDVKIGELYLWDTFFPSGYAKISAEKDRINFEGKSGTPFGFIGLDTFAFVDNSSFSFQIKKPSVLTNNHTAFFQNTSGTIAYLGDIPEEITLTTIGDSGPATLIGNVLNIPEYSGGGSSYIFSSPLSESLGVVSISQSSTISDGYLSLTDFNTFNNKQDAITLTTIGGSGASTFIGNVLNIPEYTLGSLGGVPYIGATQNVDLGEHQLKAGQIEFDQTPTGSAGVGVMRWNNTDGTVDLGLKGGNVTLQIGQENVILVVNKTGANLLESQYKVVRVRTQAEGGAQGQRLAVVLAQADTKANHSGILGIVTENINNNQEGFITTFGYVREINTTGSLQGETWIDGDVLWLSETVAGGLTNIEPTTHPVQIGYVVYAHSNNGKIYVNISDGVDQLNELHDVLITSPVNNELLAYNSSNQLWENKSLDEITGEFNYIMSTPVSYSGSAAEVEVLRLELPPYTFAANDMLKIPTLLVQKTGTVNAYVIRVKLSTSSTMPTTTTDMIATYSGGNTTVNVNMSRTWLLSGGILRGLGTSNSVTDSIASTVQLNVAFDHTITNYLYVSIDSAGANDTQTLVGFQLTNR